MYGQLSILRQPACRVRSYIDIFGARYNSMTSRDLSDCLGGIWCIDFELRVKAMLEGSGI